MAMPPTLDRSERLFHREVALRDVAGKEITHEGVLHVAHVPLVHQHLRYVRAPQRATGESGGFGARDGLSTFGSELLVDPVDDGVAARLPAVPELLQDLLELPVAMVEQVAQKVDVLEGAVGDGEFQRGEHFYPRGGAGGERLVDALHGVVVGECDRLKAKSLGHGHQFGRGAHAVGVS
jgi:hypothetical protein